MARGDGIEILSDIDTENKRRSVVQILPVPDSIIDKADREHSAGLYRGIAASPLVDGRIFRYAPLDGLSGQGQLVFNPME